MYNIANAINKELSMSKYKNTPSNKNKTQTEFNDSLYSNILSLISVILSVLSLVCAIWIGKIANEFATKNSHLNYQLSVENPIAIELKNQELHVVEAQVNKERPNFNYNIMSFKINFDPLYISGEYCNVIFASCGDEGVDMRLFPRYNLNSDGQSNLGYRFKYGELLVLDYTTQNQISFHMNKFSNSNSNYSIMHVILQGYNGDYQIFTMIYSTITFEAYILDNISVNCFSEIEELKNTLSIEKSSEELISQIREERTMIINSL